jgi:hypothetical protein
MDVAALALVLVVAILAVLVWLTHRDVLHRSFDVLIEEMRADRAAQVSERAKDRVVWQEALTSTRVPSLADIVIALVRRQQPGPAE